MNSKSALRKPLASTKTHNNISFAIKSTLKCNEYQPISSIMLYFTFFTRVPFCVHSYLDINVNLYKICVGPILERSSTKQSEFEPQTEKKERLPRDLVYQGTRLTGKTAEMLKMYIPNLLSYFISSLAFI